MIFTMVLSASVYPDSYMKQESKKCTKCKKVKVLSRFGWKNVQHIQRNTQCKQCMSAHYAKVNRDKAKGIVTPAYNKRVTTPRSCTFFSIHPETNQPYMSYGH